MFSFVKYFILNLVFLVVHTTNTMLLEDMETLFHDKHCIEASLISLFLNSGTPEVMLDSQSEGLNEKNLVNHTLKFDKTVTSKINELAQYNNIEIVYKLITEEGPPHAKIYTVSLVLGDENYEGSGSSTKKAQQAAATLALENTFYEHPPEKLDDKKESLTPTVALNNVATKLGMAVSYHLLDGKEEKTVDSYGAADESYGKTKSYYEKINSTGSFRIPVEDTQISGPFTVKVRVRNLEFKGFGHTVQAARHDAASKALKNMEKEALLKNNVCLDEDSVEDCKKQRESLKSPISRVHEAAQQLNLGVEFNIISETGKAHKKTFVTECKLGGFRTEGEATSKKESKRIAAENMLQYLPHMGENYDEKLIVNSFSNKKKKRRNKKKIIKTGSDKLINTVSQMFSSVWSTSDETNPTNNQLPKSRKGAPKTGIASAKDKILEISNGLNIPVDFTDLNKYGDKFYSLVSLGVKPPHICLGKAATREKSHETAALHGIKFLRDSGVFDKNEFIHFKEIDFGDNIYLEDKDGGEFIYLEEIEKQE